MAFQFKGGRDNGDLVIAGCEVGGKRITATASSFESRGETMHVVRIEGVGKPVIMGAQKFCAIIAMQEDIAKYFRSLGQID